MTDTAPGQDAPDLGVPAGPGVVPPFPAPPVEGRSTRLWVGLGVGALVLVLCGGGGAAALFGLIVTTTRAVTEQVDAAVNGYFGALRDKRYDEAYKVLCPKAKRTESVAAFTDRVSTNEPIRSFKARSAPLTSTAPVVPVDIVYTDGTRGTVQVELAQNPDTGRFEVCDVQE
jgi:hypothetical protein